MRHVAEPPTAPATPPDPGIAVPRVLARVRGLPGPTLVVIGSLHGNEPAGALALLRLAEALKRPAGRPIRGAVVALTGNRAALALNRRYIRDDLNRVWTTERLARVRAPGAVLENEDVELAELDVEIERARQEATGAVAILDLHSMSGPGHAFVTLDDTLRNRALAMRLPSPCVLGLEEELQGTLTDYFVGQGLTAFGFEAGQLYDPQSVDRAEAAVWIALETLGIVASGEWPEVRHAHAVLAADRGSLPAVVDVRHREAIDPTRGFQMLPGFISFQPVTAGQPLAATAQGPVHAPMSGLILMPLYQGQGSDGFFIVRRVHPVWLAVSSVARRLPLRPLLAWLPGVTRHPTRRGSFVVDTARARWLALQLFHLLGFRRQARMPHGLVMTPRGE